jgi:hypothetical protein
MFEENRQMQQTLEFIILVVIKLLTDKTSSLLMMALKSFLFSGLHV